MASFFNNYFFIVLAILAGIAMTMQAGINSKLAAVVQSPILAAFISFAVGTVALFFYMLLTGVSLSNLTLSRNAPLIAWSGGLLGAFFVTAIVTVVPRIGMAMAFSLAIGGQMIAALVIDRFGLFGVPVKEINLMRVLGAALITIGVILIRKF